MHGMPAAHVASASPRGRMFPSLGLGSQLRCCSRRRLGGTRKQRATLQSREQSRAGLPQSTLESTAPFQGKKTRAGISGEEWWGTLFDPAQVSSTIPVRANLHLSSSARIE